MKECASIANCPVSQKAIPENNPATSNADALTCRRLREDSMIYSICLDNHPGGAIDCLKNVVSFVSECLPAMSNDPHFILTQEGASGLWFILNMVQKGLGEIEEAF